MSIVQAIETGRNISPLGIDIDGALPIFLRQHRNTRPHGIFIREQHDRSPLR